VYGVRLCFAAMLATLFVLSASLLVAVSSARPVFAEAEPSDGIASTEVEAVAEALQSQQPVEVSSLLGPRSSVRALPSGQLEQTIHTAPVRVFKEGRYVGIDTRLKRLPNGDLTPVAAPLDVVFSGGGNEPFARLSRAGRELSLTWPHGSLPTPAVAGEQATYAEVLPGVDLVVQVTLDGAFSHVLVVKNAEAASQPQLAQLRLGASGKNLELAAGPGGAVSANDSGGAGAVFTAEPAAMWDSGPGQQTSTSPAPASPSAASTIAPPPSEPSTAPDLAPSTVDGPGQGAETARIDTAVDDGELVLEPDMHMLSDPKTSFPVYLDPRWHAPAAGRHMQVRSSEPYGFTPMSAPGGEGVGKCDNSSGPAGMAGHCGSTYTGRVLYQFPIGTLSHQNIISAEFRAYQTHNVSPTATNVKLYRVKKIGDSTTWANTNSSSFWFKWIYTKASRYGAKVPGSSEWAVGPDWLTFAHPNLRQAVYDAAQAGADSIAFGLRAEDEGSWANWKRFRYDAQLQVLYNLPPQQIPNEYMATVGQGYSKGCIAPDETFPRVVAPPSKLVILAAPDPNNDMRQVEFQLGWSVSGEGFRWRLGVGDQDHPERYLLSAPSTSPNFEVALDERSIPPETPIQWRARTHDFKVNDNGNPITTPPAGGHISDMWQSTGSWSDFGNATPWSSPTTDNWVELSHTCTFYYDKYAPGEPSVVSDEYPPDRWSNEVGKPGNFRIIAPAGEPPVKYKYWFYHPRATAAEKEVKELQCSDLTRCLIMGWTPQHYGKWTLQVWAVDGAGRGGGSHNYGFSVLAKVDEKAWWALDDPGSSLSVADKTGTNAAKLTNATGPVSGLLQSTGRISSALKLRSPEPGNAEQYAETAGPVIDPAQTYAVSAWAKPDQATWIKKIAAQDGASENAFGLEYLGQEKRWAFTIVKADRQDPGVIQAKAPQEARPGQWTHLVGVHDATARQLRLFVDGELRATASYPAGWLEFTRANAGAFTIGRGKWHGQKVDGWSGQIDDVHVFDAGTKIDGTYVKDKLFKPTVSARWPMEQAGGTPRTTPDTEFVGQNAVLNGGATISTSTDLDAGCSPAVVGFPGSTSPGCLMLDGLDDHAATASPVLRTDQDFTIAGWALLPNANPRKSMTAFAQAGVHNSGFSVRWDPDAGGCTTDANGDGEPDQDDEGNVVTTCNGRWQLEMPNLDQAPTSRPQVSSTFGRRIRGDDRPDHLAVVYRAAVGTRPATMALYVNGQLEQTATNSAWAQVHGSWYSPTGAFLIGATKSNSTIGEFFSGAIDDVWAYRGALTQAQLQKLSNGGVLATREGEPDASYTP
jgi:concanavalin A-like lectin/glucanase superfamily protein